MKISLCIEPVFEDLSFEDRIAAARDCGVDAIEFWDAASRDRTAIARACERVGLPVAAISVFDSWKVRLNDAPRTVLANIDETIRMGKDLECKHFIALSGDCNGNRAQTPLLIENLKRVAEVAEKHDVIVVLEALNSLYDHKGYYLDSAEEGISIIRSVNSSSIKFLYDVYHVQIMEGNLINGITQHIDAIGHFHFAGVPGRHEPQNGEINYAAVVRAIEKMNYAGYCGLEYWPTMDSNQSVSETVNFLRKAVC